VRKESSPLSSESPQKITPKKVQISTLVKFSRGFEMSQLVRPRHNNQTSYFESGNTLNKIMHEISVVPIKRFVS
jgi:hypothetical protein